MKRIAVILIVIGIFFWLGSRLGRQITSSITEHQIKDCKMWSDESGKYKLFAIENWQADQCYRHGIVIPNAIVFNK